VTDIVFMGYVGLDQTGSGLRQRLYSRAFIVGDLKNPKDRIVYLVLDLQAGDTAVRDGVLQGLKKMGQEYSVYNKNNIAVTGTHSHSGPGGWTNYFLHHVSTLGFDRPTWEAVVNGTILSIKRAHESLQEGRLSYGRIRLEDASINRSPYAYNANPPAERKKYFDNVDRDLSLLRFADLNHKPLGILTFFAIHGTSMLNNNTIVTGDNKGVASYLFEKKMEGTNAAFVAGFSQSNVGDVSPNVLGAFCEGGPEDGKPCKIEDSTCGGKVGPCHARGPFPRLNDGGTKSCFEIGKRQYEKAFELFEMMEISPPGAKDIHVRGPVKAFHTFKDMSFFEFPHPNGTTVQTCPPALGYSFAAGTTDGPGIADFKQGLNTTKPDVSVIWPILSGILRTPTDKQRNCQLPKPVLLDIGEMSIPYAWGPNILDIQLMRIGPVVIIISTGEATTMAGRRWRNAISDAVSKSLLFYDHPTTSSAKPIVLLGGPANSYTHYITTEEEYAVQRYEGASTLYGPHTLNALIHLTTSNLKYLSLNNLESVPSGPEAPDNTNQAWSFISGVPTDRTTNARPFGRVIRSPMYKYQRGQTASVTFVGASPRNNFRLEGSYAVVQRLLGVPQASNTSLPTTPSLTPNRPSTKGDSWSGSQPTPPLPRENAWGPGSQSLVATPSVKGSNPSLQAETEHSHYSLPPIPPVIGVKFDQPTFSLDSDLQSAISRSSTDTDIDTTLWIDASAPGAILNSKDATADPAWETVLTDFDWDLIFRWKRTSIIAASLLGGPSETVIEWEIGGNTAAGTYRIVYNGDAKDASGNITPFQGVTGPFKVE
jgi:neutral ceramidase